MHLMYLAYNIYNSALYGFNHTDIFSSGEIVSVLDLERNTLLTFIPPWRSIFIQLPVQSVYIATNVVSSHPAHGDAYSLQHFVIQFVSDLRQKVSGLLWVLRFLPPIKLTATI